MNFFPKIQTPYYIWAPPYTHESSGVRILHLLVHALNESGERAYLLPTMDMATHPHLNTPVVSAEHFNFYKSCAIDPIVVYPDIVQGNPMGTSKVVRYLLADAGKYGGDKIFPKANKIYGYTTSIARHVGTHNVLCLPSFDTGIFYPPSGGSIRQGSCFYAHKYDRIHSNKLLDITNKSTRLMGTPEQLADVLRKSEVCYVYEMSEVIVNAELCGCPVVFVKTPYFNGIPEDWDYSYYSARWEDGFDAGYPSDCLADMQKFQVIRKMDIFKEQLQSFIQDTRQWTI